MKYVYIFLTIALTIYGQIVIKWCVLKAGALPVTFSEKMGFLFHLVLNPWIISAFLAAFIASLTWMAAMTKLQLSYAYPFLGLSFALVLVFSNIFFSEPITWQKIIGVALVMAGIAVIGYVR